MLPMGRTYMRDVILVFAGWSLLPHRLRPSLLRLAGLHVGRGVLIYGELGVSGNSEIVIEDDVFINRACFIDSQAAIHISRGARIGDHVRLITSSHVLGPRGRRAGPGESFPIHVGTGAWIGSGACLLPGVTIAPGCIVGAGAVVTASTEPDGLYVGVPARRVRTLDARGEE